MMMHSGDDVGVNRSRAIIKANGLHMGSTRQVSHNEIVLITVRHPKQKSEIAVM